MSRPKAIPKRMPRNLVPRYLPMLIEKSGEKFDGVPTGSSEYQDGICKLGEIILRYDIHAKRYLDSSPFAPCKGCVKPKPKNWLATQLSRIEYKKLAEMQKRLCEELLDFNKDVEKVRNVNQMKFAPYFKSEYQAAYGQYRPGRWITRRVELD